MRFDAYTIAFGLRNVADQQKALQEAYRCCGRAGGSCAWNSPMWPCRHWRSLYDLYSFQAPLARPAGRGDRDSYQYLVESIRRFPTQDQLCGMIAQAGFRQVGYRNLSAGIAALHSGWRV